jgi:hypothetical protein
MMWMLKEVQGKQTFVYISRCDTMYDKDSTRTINHNSILTVNKSDSLKVDGVFCHSLYP